MHSTTGVETHALKKIASNKAKVQVKQEVSTQKNILTKENTQLLAVILVVLPNNWKKNEVGKPDGYENSK